MAFKTYQRFCKVQGCVFIRFTSSIPTKLASIFFGDPDKFFGALAMLSGPFNVLIADYAGPKAPLRTYLHKNI